MRIVAVASAVFPLLVACGGDGGGSSDGASGERLLPTSKIELLLQMREEPTTLQRSLGSFAENNGVVLRVGSLEGERPALVELSAVELSEWLHADRLLPLPAALADLAAECWGADGGMWEGQVFALPWRVRPQALALSTAGEFPSDWPSLQAFQQASGAWASDQSSLLPSLLSLVASDGRAFEGASAAPVVDSDAWSEALSFFTRSLALEQLCSADELERRFVSGAVAIAPVDPARWKRLRALQPDRPLTLISYPPLDVDVGQARAALELRFLVLPRNGAHPDLAVSLARQLHARAGELLADIHAGFVPARRDAALDWEEWKHWQSVLADGFALPPFPRRGAWDEALGHAVRQAIDRKRNPAQALSDAQDQFADGRDP